MQITGKHLNENSIGALVIIGTLALSHIAFLDDNILREAILTNIPAGFSSIGNLIFILPGIVSSIAYAILTKNITKAVVVGILTNVFWFIWVMICVLAAFRIH